MILKDTEQALSSLLISVGTEEKGLEVARQILCGYEDFDLATAFDRLDRKRNCAIGATDVHEFLADNGVFYSLEQCESFVRRHDSNADSRITLENLTAAILPKEDYTLRTMTAARRLAQKSTHNTRNPLSQTDLLSKNVELGLTRLISQEIIAATKFESLKKVIFQRYDYQSTEPLFSAIDIFNSSVLSINNLEAFFEYQGLNIPVRDIEAMIRYLDRHDSRSVSKSDFNYFLEPQLLPYLASRNGEFSSKLQSYIDKKTTPSVFYHLNGENHTPSTGIPSGFIGASQRTNQSIQKHIKSNLKSSLKSKENNAALDNVKSPFQQQSSTTTTWRKHHSNEESGELARTLKHVIALEMEVQHAKESLVLRADFNLLDAFRLFDVDGKQRLSAHEIATVLEGVGLHPGRHELYLILRRYSDDDSDGLIRFAQFQNMFSPLKPQFKSLGHLNPQARVTNEISSSLTNNQSNNLNSRYPQNQSHSISNQNNSQAQTNKAYSTWLRTKEDIFYAGQTLFSAQTKNAMIDLIILMLENEAAQETLRQRLHKRKHFDIKSVFQLLQDESEVKSDSKNAVLDARDFQSLFENNGIIIPKEDIRYLLARFDKNGDGLVSLADFIAELSPKSPKKLY